MHKPELLMQSDAGNILRIDAANKHMIILIARAADHLLEQ